MRNILPVRLHRAGRYFVAKSISADRARGLFFVTVFAAVALAALPQLASASNASDPGPDQKKTVLFLSGERGDLPSVREVEESVREIFHASTDPEIELFPEYLDFARFPAEQHTANDLRYLRDRYADRKIDLILAVTGLGLEFALAHRDELFPGVPIVFCATDEREVQKTQLPPDVTGIVGHFDIERSLQLIFALQPGVSEIVCVGGTSAFDRRWEEETRLVLERLGDKARVRWITDKSLEDTVREVAQLPPSSAVFYICMLRDGAGHFMTATDALRDICRASKVPVYGVTSQFLEVGIVGGAIFDFRTNGHHAGDLALRVLRGESVPFGSPELEIRNPLVVNWSALRKWNIPEARVPAEAEVRHKTLSVWERHKPLILGGAGLVLLQAVLIAGLISQRLWRREAESSLRESERRNKTAAEEARQRREQVDLLSRVSLLGEMTASLAHELNQPLSAIVSNAHAGMRFIDKGKIDPTELREILADVAEGGRRANEIIHNVRSAIKKGSAIRARINMNDLVRSVTHMVNPDAAAHSCKVEVSLAENLPVIEGDPTQMQQALINLVRNAFDAMDDTPPNKRVVQIATEWNGDGIISVGVRDHGPGITPSARDHLFEHFFTTKEDGLGMGLSIVRSIIENHGGKIAAENVNDGGARFYFNLPCSNGT